MLDGLQTRVAELLTRSEDPARRGNGMLWVAIAVFAGVAVAVGLYAVTSGIDVQTSSSAPVRWTATVLTSVWTFAAVGAIVAWGVVYTRDSKKASAAAKHTGVPKQTVRRLALEVKSTSGTSRVIVDSDDDDENVEDSIRRKLDGEDPDSYGTNPGVHGDISGSTTTDDGVSEEWFEDTHVPVTNGEDTDQDEEEEDEEDDDGAVLSARDRWTAWKLDTAAALDRDDLIWKFAAPAAVIAVTSVLALGIWIRPIALVGIVSASAAVGLTNLYRVKRKRLRRLGKYRDSTTARPVDTASVLLKTVETPDMTVYVAWVGGHRYASPDREEFVEGVASRAIEWAVTGEVRPSVMERFASELESMRPCISAYRDFERNRIGQLLVDKIEDARIAPRGWLIESVVEDGLDRSSPEQELGHDPRAVREMYELLTPAVLVEEPVTVQDTDGGDREVRAVRLRGDPIRPGDAQDKARFSTTFGAHSEGGDAKKYGSPRVDMGDGPDVSVPLRDASDVAVTFESYQ